MYLGTTPGATPYILGAQTNQRSVVVTGGPSGSQSDSQSSGRRWKGASPKASSIQVLHLSHLSAPWTSKVCCRHVSPLMLARPPTRHRLCASESSIRISLGIMGYLPGFHFNFELFASLNTILYNLAAF